jgi:aryl-alcohol dehydrogenase-like predicted oxidoreductase
MNQLPYSLIWRVAEKEIIPATRAKDIYEWAYSPLAQGLLTGKFTSETRFQKNDHRMFRLPPELLVKSLEKLEPVWDLADKYNINKTSLAVSFILSHYEISTVIPGIKTVKQAVENTAGIIKLNDEDINYLHNYFNEELSALVDLYETAG